MPFIKRNRFCWRVLPLKESYLLRRRLPLGRRRPGPRPAVGAGPPILCHYALIAPEERYLAGRFGDEYRLMAKFGEGVMAGSPYSADIMATLLPRHFIAALARQRQLTAKSISK